MAEKFMYLINKIIKKKCESPPRRSIVFFLTFIFIVLFVYWICYRYGILLLRRQLFYILFGGVRRVNTLYINWILVNGTKMFFFLYFKNKTKRCCFVIDMNNCCKCECFLLIFYFFLLNKKISGLHNKLYIYLQGRESKLRPT